MKNIFEFTIPKAVKAKWLKALRSGEYKQTKCALYNPKTGGFCCLGVLQHVTMDGEVEYDCYSERYATTPSEEFWKYIGAKGVTSDNAYNDGVIRLVVMNDQYRYGFKRIADFIERNLGTH